ncbi:hypothetical protein M0805_005549 [Coniferiporia weirii]|nr:hypothetical protein M0805_005549 [Coniferiporia weirii]
MSTLVEHAAPGPLHSPSPAGGPSASELVGKSGSGVAAVGMPVGERVATGSRTPIPEVSLNGGGAPASAPAQRAPKSSAAPSVSDADSAWGANFWVTLIEPQSQTPFYACPATGQVSWDPPVGNFVLPPSAEGEWWELVDESRGIPYYYHTKSNETVWERPEGFVIPLGILQNTAVCRRLSARYSQIMDVDIMAMGEQGEAARLAYRRSISDSGVVGGTRKQGVDAGAGAGAGANGRRVQPPAARGAAPQTPKRSTSTDQYRQHHNHHHHHHHHSGPGFGGTQLPPIPASPYQTEESTPPSPKSKHSARANANANANASANVNAKQREKGGESGKEGGGKGKERERSRERPSATESISRARSKSASLMSHRMPQPQSLNAAAERIAHESTPPRQQHDGHGQVAPPTPISPTWPASEGVSNISTFAPQAISSPARPHALTISVETPATNPRGAHLLSPVPTPTSSSPATFFSSLSLSKGKGVEKAYGTGAGASPASDAQRNQIPVPQAPAMPRRSIGSMYPGSIRTQDIGLPTLNARATLNLSPVKARSEGKPILLDTKKNSVEGDDTGQSTGGRPVLPDDLVSEIQQFVQTEFARQYFTTHRTGFIFRRKIPVEKMMIWQKAPLQSPLLVLNRELHKDAVRVFKVIQRIMGDRDRDRPVVRHQHSDNHLGTMGTSTVSLNASSTSLPSLVSGILEEERWLLGEGLTHGELRDEIYCQLVKQVTGNPNPESVFRGWQLLCVLLVTFPPSKNFEAYLRSFISQHAFQTEGRVDIMAKYCQQRLSIISKKGPRGKPPTLAEIETASDAAFNPSTFGEPLDAVIRLQERMYPQLQVPIVLPFLADGILALGGTKSEGIFRIPGDGDSVSELKIRIERGYYNLEGVDDPHVPASLLKLWLRELADPLVPTELYNDCVACAKDPDACVQMVARLPTINRRVVLFVVSFLQLFLDDKIQSVTKMTSANLALVMAPNLLRCDSESMTVVFTNAPYEQMFVHNLLLHLKCSKVDPGYVPKHGLGSAVTAPSMGRSSKSRSRRPVR